MNLGEILTGSQCIAKGYQNDSMGQLIDENYYYANLFVGGCGLYKVTVIDSDKELVNDLKHIQYATQQNGRMVEVEEEIEWEDAIDEAQVYVDSLPTPPDEDTAWYEKLLEYLKENHRLIKS